MLRTPQSITADQEMHPVERFEIPNGDIFTIGKRHAVISGLYEAMPEPDAVPDTPMETIRKINAEGVEVLYVNRTELAISSLSFRRFQPKIYATSPNRHNKWTGGSLWAQLADLEGCGWIETIEREPKVWGHRKLETPPKRGKRVTSDLRFFTLRGLILGNT